MAGLMDVLRERYAEFSPSQRAIADYLSTHLADVQFLTAKQLAERCQVSESGVVRFAQLLGFSGYPELRRVVRDEFRQSASHTAMMTTGVRALAESPDLIDAIAQRDASLVLETASRLDPEALERCVAMILEASEVYVVGHRTSHALAEYFASALRQGIGIGMPLSYGIGMLFDFIASAPEGAVVVAVTLTPPSADTLDLLRAAKARGFKRIVITDYPLNEAARLADEVLLVETEVHAFTSSFVGVMTTLHILLALIGRQTSDRAEAFLARVEEQRLALGARFQRPVSQDDSGPTRP